jgi:hypothetical protein
MNHKISLYFSHKYYYAYLFLKFAEVYIALATHPDFLSFFQTIKCAFCIVHANLT